MTTSRLPLLCLAAVLTHAGVAAAASPCKLAATTQIAAGGADLFQLHADGSIWRFTGTACSSAGCPGWQRLDDNPAAAAIAASAFGLFQLHTDGALWRYTGTPCTATSCPGWQQLDHNHRTVEILAGPGLYQVHAN